MLFIFCVSSLLLIYCLVIKIGHHTVSFNRYLAMISGSLWLCALLDLYKIIQLPMILKLGIILGVGYGIFFVTMLALFSKQRDQKHHDIDVIFVFGAGLIGNRITLSLKKRLQKAIELAYIYPDAPIIVSGGQGRHEATSEAKAMHDFLVNQGIDTKRILLEDKSTSTQENLVYALKLYPLKGKKIALISNQFHVYRTEKMARKLKLDGIGVPAYMNNIGTLAFYIREYFACIKAFLKREI